MSFFPKGDVFGGISGPSVSYGSGRKTSIIFLQKTRSNRKLAVAMKEGEGGRYLFLTFYKIILTYSYSTGARVHEDNDNVCLMLLSSWFWRSSGMTLLPFQDAS